MKKVYFTSDYKTADEFLEYIRPFSPDESCKWESITATLDRDEAEYLVALNQPDPGLDSDRLLLFCRETPWNDRCDWEDIDALRKYPLSDNYLIQVWWVDRSYDELKGISAGDLTKMADLSWITTDRGKIDNPVWRLFRRTLIRHGVKKHERKWPTVLNKGGTDGHVLRMQFLERLTDQYPDLLDLYGRGDFSGPYYRGELADKWDGLAPYRYSLALENYKGKNYFGEQLADALLAWCMPIYWGCTNLSEYLPENSYVWIDIEDDAAPERVREVVNSDLREQNLDAIAEARRRILDKYQVWPTVHRIVEEVSAESCK
ncbi:MAG: glycosyltransferase family 10 domain-containing protein [Halorhabdus sp.]